MIKTLEATFNTSFTVMQVLLQMKRDIHHEFTLTLLKKNMIRSDCFCFSPDELLLFSLRSCAEQFSLQENVGDLVWKSVLNYKHLTVRQKRKL